MPFDTPTTTPITNDPLGPAERQAQQSPQEFDPDAKFELSEYWGDLQGDDLGDAVKSIREGFEQFLHNNAYHFRWGRFNYYYYDHFMDIVQPMRPGLVTMGEAGEYTFIGINEMRSIAKTMVATMTSNPPAFKCNASNTDTDSKKNAELFQTVLDYYMAVRGIRADMDATVENALITDAAYLLVEWDPGLKTPGANPEVFYDGDITTARLTGWDVYFDPVCDNWEKLPWIITRQWVPRHQVVAKYPDFKKEIMAQSARQEVMQKDFYLKQRIHLNYGSGRHVSDQIEVVKLFHAKTAYMPEGRFAVFLGDGKMLFDNPAGLPYPMIPVKRMVLDEDRDSLLGWSPLSGLTAAQELLNELNSAVATNQSNTAVQAVAVARGTDVNPRNVGKLMLLEYPSGSQPPQGLSLTKTAPEVFQFIADLRQQMQVMVGVAPASRGIAGNQTSGSAMLFQASQTSQNQSPANANYERFASEVGTLILHILQTFANNPRTIAIMGEKNAQRATFESSNFDTFDRVIATLGNPLTQTDQGKLAVAQQLLQYGDITPQQFFEVLETGNLEVATEPMEQELLYIDEENDALQGGQDIQPVATDNHELHVGRHRLLLNNVRARNPATATKQDQAMLAATTKHIQEHMKLQAGNQQAQATMNRPGAPPTKLPTSMGGPHPQPAGNGAQYGNTQEVSATNPARTQGQATGVRLPRQPRTRQPIPGQAVRQQPPQQVA